MTWIKRFLFLSVIFFGLYYFGDFRINEVNVRDYLQAHVTKEDVDGAKNFLFKIYQAAHDLYDSYQKNKKDPNSPAKDHPIDALMPSLQDISDADHKKFIKTINENLPDRAKNQ